MSFDMAVMVTFVVISNVAMYLTLPLHIRLFYVLIFPSKNIKLDNSFHTLMINSTIGNLIFSTVFCLNQAPAGAGLLFEFYQTIGPFFSHIEQIKSAPLLMFTTCLHFVLAASRFTAIAFPIRHPKIWLRVSHLCALMWILTLLVSIPLMIPGSTGCYTTISVFGLRSVEYTFGSLDYYMAYSVSGVVIGSAVGALTIFLYIAMIAKFHEFRKFTKSNASDVRRMTRGVVRTTVAAVTTSMGPWIIVIFFIIVCSYSFSHGGTPLFDNLHFYSIFFLLNAINNVLTPWVLLIAFPNVRAMFFFNLVSRRETNSGEKRSALSMMKTNPKVVVTTTSRTRTSCF